MANINFHTPLTGSTFTVQATGTLLPGFAGYLVIDLAVNSTNASYPRALTHFKKSLALSTTSTGSNPYDVTSTLAIVPKQTTKDSVAISWGLSETP